MSVLEKLTGFARTFYGVVNEDGSARIMGRAMSFDATGTSVAGEGKCLKQADLTSINHYVYDTTDDALIVSGALTPISSYISDTLLTDTYWDLTLDATGYNFYHNIGVTAFPNPRTYKLLYKFTTTGSVIGWGEYRLQARKTSA